MRLGKVRSPMLTGVKSWLASSVMDPRSMSRLSGWQSQQSGAPGVGSKQQPRAGPVPGERADRAVAGLAFAHQNLGGVAEAAKQHQSVGVADGCDQRARMEGDLGDALRAHAALTRRLAHRPVLFLEWPDDAGFGAGGREP